jgi:hypothetical protein
VRAGRHSYREPGASDEPPHLQGLLAAQVRLRAGRNNYREAPIASRGGLGPRREGAHPRDLARELDVEETSSSQRSA